MTLPTFGATNALLTVLEHKDVAFVPASPHKILSILIAVVATDSGVGEPGVIRFYVNL